MSQQPCTFCGRLLLVNQTVCPYCNTAQPTQRINSVPTLPFQPVNVKQVHAVQPIQPVQKNNTAIQYLLILMTFLMLALLVVGILLLSKAKPDLLIILPTVTTTASPQGDEPTAIPAAAPVAGSPNSPVFHGDCSMHMENKKIFVEGESWIIQPENKDRIIFVYSDFHYPLNKLLRHNNNLNYMMYIKAGEGPITFPQGGGVEWVPPDPACNWLVASTWDQKLKEGNTPFSMDQYMAYINEAKMP
jgi:hypothetical protein